ncbi:hypothetical protein ACFWDN_19730 [Micromonospora chalcea]
MPGRGTSTIVAEPGLNCVRPALESGDSAAQQPAEAARSPRLAGCVRRAQHPPYFEVRGP